MRTGFNQVIVWLRQERSYQTKKFNYAEEKDKNTDYWMQQFDSYLQRIQVHGVEAPLGIQASLKLAATAVALCEHLADQYHLPKPGVSSGTLDYHNQA